MPCSTPYASSLLVMLASPVNAAAIASRPALQALLGGPGSLEDFEAFSVAGGTSSAVECATLDSSAICTGPVAPCL